jgi:hypothetical protein
MEKIIEYQRQRRRAVINKNLGIFVRKNRKHIDDLYNIVTFYNLDVDYSQFAYFCYKNSLDYVRVP